MKKCIVAFTMTMGILLFVSVSLGRAEVVPNVVGMSVYNAAMALGKAKLTSNLQTVVTANQRDNNQVFKQSPSAGTTVNAGTRVQLFAYRYQPGQQPAAGNQSAPYRIVPQITNTRADQAQSVLLRQGFKASISYVDTPDQRRNGYVFKQSPPAGQKAAPGSAVTLQVYRYRKVQVQVPKVTGVSREQAVSILQGKGLKVRWGNLVPSSDQRRIGIIASQSPAPGQAVAPGTEVRLDFYQKIQDMPSNRSIGPRYFGEVKTPRQ